MPNLIGQSLGRYHILEQIGEGGMAIVYKAFDTRLERERYLIFYSDDYKKGINYGYGFNPLFGDE
jgi:serine/threonine protein kinase